MTFNLCLSRARTGVVAMRQDSSYYNNWIPQNWGEKGVKFNNKKTLKKKVCASKGAEWAKIHPTYCGKLEMFDHNLKAMLPLKLVFPPLHKFLVNKL